MLLALAYSQSYIPNVSYVQPFWTIPGDRSPLPYNYPMLGEIKVMLHQAPNLNDEVINKVLTAIKCSTTYNVDHNNVLTVIDYSMPSNQKRLWVFDLGQKKLLFNTYVSHGIKSGTLFTNFFSNQYNSKASSMGVYTTEKAYYGREGLSLRLAGLDRHFNDNASNRSIVMHGGWYMDELFIKKYGRPGRSWGCPALPPDQYQAVINTIKDKSLFVAYYPNDNWFGASKFLNCEKTSDSAILLSKDIKAEDEHRADVLLARVGNRKMEDPILTMPAPSYEHIFHTKAPLGRMLRRQINSVEYIALSTEELNQLSAQKNQEAFNSMNFVIPNIIMVRGYYETQMKIVSLGKIKDIKANTVAANNLPTGYTVSFEEKPSVSLKPTNQFIRWVGL